MNVVQKSSFVHILRIIRFLNAKGIQTEKLFSSAPAPKAVQELRVKLEKGEIQDFQGCPPTVVAQLLRAYLTEMAEPLLTFELYSAFVSAAKEPVQKERARKLRALILQLPSHSKTLAEILFLFLSRVVDQQGKNLMGADQLATLFGPLVLRPRDDGIASVQSTTQLDPSASVVKAIITDPEVLGTGKETKDAKDSNQIKVQLKEPVREERRNSKDSLKLPDALPIVSISPANESPIATRLANRPAGDSPLLSEDSSSDPNLSDPERIAKVKRMLDGAILSMISRLELLKLELHSVDNVPDAIEIAKKIRTTKRLLDGLCDNPPNSPRPPKEKEPVLYQYTPRGVISVDSSNGPALHSGLQSIQGRRKTMEDCHLLVDDISKIYSNESAKANTGKSSFYAVYDGHGGIQAAKMAQDLVVKNFVTSEAFINCDFISAFAYSFAATDKQILDTSARDNWKDGSTAAVAFLLGKNLFTANIGDSEIVLSRKTSNGTTPNPTNTNTTASSHHLNLKEVVQDLPGHLVDIAKRLSPRSHLTEPPSASITPSSSSGSTTPGITPSGSYEETGPFEREPIVLSFKHIATNDKEKERIEKAGGHVFFGRVYGQLAVTRSFGDSEFKKPTADDDFVTANPFTKHTILDHSHEFVIIACDGLWEKVVYQEAINSVAASRAAGKTSKEACEILVNTAYEKRSRDNITAIVVYFQWD